MSDFWTLHDAILNQEIKDNQERPKRIAAESWDIIARNSSMLQANAERNGVNQEILVPRTKAKEIKVFCHPGDELFAGDYLTFDDETWIVVEAYTNEVGILKGRALICNHLFKFQNGTPEIVERWGAITDGNYTNKDNRSLPLEEGYFNVFLPLDDYTKKIYIGKRFATGISYDSKYEEVLSAIKVVWLDKKTSNLTEGDHLLKFRAQIDVTVTQNDDVDKMICDFVKDDTRIPIEPESPEDPALLGRCVITGSSSIRLGSPRSYTVTVVDDDGNAVDTSADTFIWEYEAVTGITFTQANEVLSINVDVKYPLLVGQDITIKAVDSIGNYAKAVFEIEII